MQYLPIIYLFFLPAYVWRFQILGWPVNILMVFQAGMLISFGSYLLLNRACANFLRVCKAIDRKLVWLAGAFLLSGVLGMLVGGVSLEKFGQFAVLFLLPILSFLPAWYFLQKYKFAEQKFWRAALVVSAVFGGIAVMQYFTGLGLPHEYLGNSVEPKRALSLFEYPNAYALFTVPLMVFVTPGLIKLIQSTTWENMTSRFFPAVCYITGGLGLLFSLSRGGWLSFAVGVLVAVILLGNMYLKKTLLVAFLGITIFVFSVPNLRYRVILPFLGEKSAVSRLSLNDTAFKMLKTSPVWGMGLLGFNNNFSKFNTDPGLEHYKYPHNFFLALWLETGLLGLISFVLLCWHVLRLGFNRDLRSVWLPAMLVILAMGVHGLVDVPYFKNDLAGLFWLLLAVSYVKKV